MRSWSTTSAWKKRSAVAAFLFLLIAALVLSGFSAAAEQELVTEWIPPRNPLLSRIMEGITFLGTHRFLIPANLLLIALYLLIRRKQFALLTGGVALSSLGWMSLLKNLFQRHRPPEALVRGISNYSFPSGHALMSITFFGLLLLLWQPSLPGWRTKSVFLTLVAVLIFLIGGSRVYLGVHYPTDVLAGYAAGLSWLWVCAGLYPPDHLRENQGL